MKAQFQRRVSLFAVLILAGVLRLWNLGGVPPSTSMDEASIGYNAYSVARTGVDEFGQFPFISQRGYDDWRRSSYLFLVAPFVSIFGLQSFAIRLPAVVLGVLTVWATYSIVMALWRKNNDTRAHAIAMVAAVLLATSPWHIYLSRIGHETNAYLSASIFGLLFFLQGETQRLRYLASMSFFTLAIVSYYAGQVFIPLLGMGLVFLYRQTLGAALVMDKQFRMLFIGVAVVCLWIAGMTFSPSAIVRFGGTSTFKPEAHWQEYTKRMERWRQAVENGDMVGRILNSSHLFPMQVFVEAYTSHYSPRWLFVNANAEPFKAPGTGLLYFWQFPFVLLGMIIVLFGKSLDSRRKTLIYLWFFLSALPGGIATGAPHAMRTYPSLFTWELFSAVGIVFALTHVKRARIYAMILMCIVSGVGIGTFLTNYFIRFPREQSASFHYAFSRAMPYVLSQEDAYKKIVFSNERNLYQSYMVFLYYSNYDPAVYLSQGGTRSGGYAETHAFGKYEFRPLVKNEILEPDTLYIVNSDDLPSGTREIASFSNLDGTMAIKAVIRQ